MAWIEYHAGLRDHWKIQRLANLLKCSYPQALGHVSCLWCWCVDNAPTGYLRRFTDLELCQASRISDTFELKKILKAVELLDANDVIHDWRKHGLNLLESKRKRQREYMSRRRQRDVNSTSTKPTEPTIPTIPNQPTSSVTKTTSAAGLFSDDQMLDLKRQIAKTMSWGIMSEATNKASEEILQKIKASKKKLTNPFGYAMGIAQKLNGVRV